MMDRRRLLLTALAGAVARPLVAGVQQMRKVRGRARESEAGREQGECATTRRVIWRF
jgi:hypothetical protein